MPLLDQDQYFHIRMILVLSMYMNNYQTESRIPQMMPESKLYIQMILVSLLKTSFRMFASMRNQFFVNAQVVREYTNFLKVFLVSLSMVSLYIIYKCYRFYCYLRNVTSLSCFYTANVTLIRIQ